jgi:alginate O-acetyltransferase complex protein AlgI
MIFNELSYFVLFLLPSVAGFHLAPHAARSWVLSAFGIAFFVYFGYLHFGGLWGGLAVVIFGWEILTSRLYRPGSRWCLFGIAQALLFLFAFKYLTFATGAWNDLARGLHLPPLGISARWFLPLGISFFTFEFIHFAADSYNGKIERSSISEYAAFILFFPSMVAGPIKRFQDFGPKLRAASFEPELVGRGITRILVGLAKKHALADSFSLWAHRLNGPELYAAHWYQIGVWILAYGMQIYFDFSGYSDIAIGSGYLFGIVIPENFDWPYLSRNINEFWRRWHISLSSWIRDYIYIPLGGSRRGERRTNFNLIIAFAASGIWHGAAYNFVVWGLWHGFMLVVHRLWTERLPRLATRVPTFAAIAMTFLSVNLGWAFFCMDMRRAAVALSRLFRLA